MFEFAIDNASAVFPDDAINLWCTIFMFAVGGDKAKRGLLKSQVTGRT